jgi:hypothetical protein
MSSPKEIYEAEIRELEPGIKRAVLRVMSAHIGKGKTVSKSDLLADVRRLGFGGDLAATTFERKVRLAIVELRKEGHLICSSSGDGGYYVASTWQEYDEFARVEYREKITDMAETLRAMDNAAAQTIGPASAQGRLF